MNFLRTSGVGCLRIAAHWQEKLGTPVADLRSARRFLFLQYETALGTAVHATPTFEALKRAVPDATIAVAGSGLPCEVLKYNPFVDEIYRTPHAVQQWGKAATFFLAQFRPRRGQFDCVVADAGNRQFRYSLLSLIMGVRHRVGFRHASDLHSASLEYDETSSLIANNLGLVGLLGHAHEPAEPAVFFSEAEVCAAESFLRELHISDDRPIVAIQTQTSGGQPNQWYDDRFVQVADWLGETRKAQVIFLGTAKECRGIDSLRAKMRSPSGTVAGRTDIPGLAALLSHCDLLVTLDTGTMHVGRAVRVPMVVIAPAQNPEHEWLPVGAKHIRILRRGDIGCAHCRKLYCATRECMDEISTGEVIEAIARQLENFPPAIEARTRRVSQRLQRSSPRV